MASLFHYGTKYHSGRYPYGSGDDPYQHDGSIRGQIRRLKDEGLTSEKEIAKALGYSSTTELRNKISADAAARRKEQDIQIDKLRDKGYSPEAIAKMTGIPASTIRSRLETRTKERAAKLEAAEKKLRETVDKKKYVDVGPGVELQLGVSKDKLNKTVAKLQDEGYEVHKLYIDQLGTDVDKKTTIKVLAKPGTTIQDAYKNKDKIATIDEYADNKVVAPNGLKKPKSLDSNRVQIRYAEEGGVEKDGVIELRRGVEDISLGNSQYAQVRIAVDGTHYLKGMAMYSDNMPKGVDVIFNTNKALGTPKEKVFKELGPDPNNPFSATIKADGGQREYIDKNGKKQLSVINKVNEEGDWTKWSKNLASQMLSKQPLSLAKQQLKLDMDIRNEQLSDIKKLSNPTLRKYLLDKFAEECDAAAVHLKAAAMPRQASKVILPISSLKDNEIYAPGFRNGETVALIRYPHGGRFEIPQLKVNNGNREAKGVMFNALDAVGINHKVAERLSGADFDGDTVLVIPNNSGAIKSMKALDQLKGFDPHKYKEYPGMKVITDDHKQRKMGEVSNLITDMTIKGAPTEDIAKAVKHSMVVIDAEKHRLDWKTSEIENNINALKVKYQGGTLKNPRGASTIISRAKSKEYIPDRREITSVSKMTAKQRKDYEAGKIVYENKEPKLDKNGKPINKSIKTTKMANATDARALMSKEQYPMEQAYANYANHMKAMANEARKTSRATKDIEVTKAAKQAYSEEVASLNSKLKVSLMNKPLERKAQAVANVTSEANIKANPSWSKAERKKERGRQLQIARDRVGAKKQQIEITDGEWQAIQSGAIAKSRVISILENTDIDRVRKLSSPRPDSILTPAKVAMIRNMEARGYELTDIAEYFGVSASTITKALA